MSQIDRVNKIAAKLLHSYEEILKYSQLNNTPELVENNVPQEEDDEEENEEYGGYYDEEEDDEDDSAETNDVITRNLLRNINAKRHEMSSIDGIEQIQLAHKHSRNVVKSLQELLLVTRNLKEKWILEFNKTALDFNDIKLEEEDALNQRKKEELSACIHDILANI